jgi:GT2 family glycosyltransferase
LNSPIIHLTLESLKNQTHGLSDVEILVVGVDEPGLVVPDHVVRFIPTSLGANAAANRNIGMVAARGSLFLFLDADCIAAPGWIEKHLARHQQGELVVGGAVTFDAHNYLTLSDNVSAFHDLMPSTHEGLRPYLVTANMSVSRKVVERVGGMDESLDRAHDLDWTVRFRLAGYRLYFDPGPIVVHNPPRHTLLAVLAHWTDDAPYTLRVRLRHRQALSTPKLAAHRWCLFWGSPAIAAWATIRTFSHPGMRHYLRTLPFVYVTKLAWCWGAFTRFPTIVAPKELPATSFPTSQGRRERRIVTSQSETGLEASSN